MKFQGIPAEGIAFLRDLSVNNNREWFTANKGVFKEYVEEPSQVLAEELAERLSSLVKRPMASKVFRIYRDVRFSKDKTPYNTHVRMLFSREGVAKESCGDTPVFCFSLECDSIITGAGCNGFSPAALTAYREAVGDAKSGGALSKVLGKYKEADGYRLDAPVLKRVPAGYDKEHARETLLRQKALMLWHEEPHPETVCSTKLATHLMRSYRKMKPLHDWLDRM